VLLLGARRTRVGAEYPIGAEHSAHADDRADEYAIDCHGHAAARRYTQPVAHAVDSAQHDADALIDADIDQHTHAVKHTDGDDYAHGDIDWRATVLHADGHTFINTYGERNANIFVNTDTHFDANRHGHADIDRYTNGYRNAHRYGDADRSGADYRSDRRHHALRPLCQKDNP
jgi:hypothetical protein